MTISLHLRAVALEYCRKRRNVDYFKKITELDLPTDALTAFRQINEDNEVAASYVEHCLSELFFPQFKIAPGHIDYFAIPFSKNLGVSCCGVFNHNNDLNPLSLIGYNILSYKDLSVLVLTTFAGEHVTLDSFVDGYSNSNGIERMVNDIAFLKGEEPLISARLWESLSDSEKHEIGLSLVHPAYRITGLRPSIVKVGPSDFLKEITPAVVARLGNMSPILMSIPHATSRED